MQGVISRSYNGPVRKIGRFASAIERYTRPVRKYAAPQDVQAVDPILTNISIGFQNGAMIADQLFPIVPVAKESGQYFIMDTDRAKFRRVDDLRAPRTRARLVDWATGTAQYVVEEHALATAVDDRERDNATAPLQPDIEGTETVTDAVLLQREFEVQQLATTAGNYAGSHVLTLVGTQQWSDPVNSDPVSDTGTLRTAIRQDSGFVPNIAVIAQTIFEKLKLHSKILDRIKYTQRGIVTLDLLAALFEVDRILIANAMQNTAGEGATPALGDIWGKDVVMAFVPPRPGIKTQALGYIFRVGDFRTRRWREESEHSDYFETGELRVAKIVSASAGGVIKAAIA